MSKRSRDENPWSEQSVNASDTGSSYRFGTKVLYNALSDTVEYAGGRSEVDGADADITLSPETGAVRLDLRIPGEQVIETDVVGNSNLVAEISRFYETELVAVRHHAWLPGLKTIGGVSVSIAETRVKNVEIRGDSIVG